MSLADAVGLARALAVIPIVMACAQGDAPLALAIFVLAALSDAIDGPLARRAGTAGARGAFVDPLADKVLVVGALAAVAATGGIATWILVLVAARETLVALLRAVTLSRGIDHPAGRTAKLKTLLEMGGVALLLAAPAATGALATAGAALVLAGLAIGIATLPRYLPGRAPALA